MSHHIDILIEDDRWSKIGWPETAVAMLTKALDILGISAAEVSVLACDDTRIGVLNAEFRDKAMPTNVLSWPEEDLASDEGAVPHAPTPGPAGTLSLGDIAISYDTCVREASAQNKPMDHHVTHLLVHGLLHLLGYDHIRDTDAVRMEALEVKILGNLGIPDPY